MRYTTVAGQFGEEFLSQPIEYGTEADLRVRLYQLLSDQLEEDGQTSAEVTDPRLVGDTRSYKEAYKRTVESKLGQRGSIDRVRLDVSVDKRRQYDIGCFSERIGSPIKWVRSGSKRFNERDLDAAFCLKFIKNKCYPPLRCSITDDSLLEMDSTELQSVFNAKENSIGSDIENLNSLPSDVTAIFILVSNNNYLFAEPLSEAEQGEQKKQQAGLGVRQWFRAEADDISVLYVHPRGSRWIVPPDDRSQ